MPQPIPELNFTTQDVSPEGALQYWTKCASEYEIRPLDGRSPNDFRASTQAWLLADLILAHGSVTAATYTRTEEKIRADAVDACILVLLTHGSWAGTFGGRHATIGSGQFAALDFTQPSHTEVSDNQYITLSISRTALMSSIPKLPDFHGAVLDNAAGYLLADHLIALTRYLSGLTVEQIPMVRQATLMLVAAAFKGLSIDREAVTEDGVRYQGKRYFERHLHESDLTPTRVAEALSLPRTSLYAAFKPMGGVASYIQKRRLQTVRALLMLPAERRTVSELATSFGFSNSSHFSQAFRQAFGQTPGAFRLGMGALDLASLPQAPTGGRDLPSRYAAWMKRYVAH